MTTIVNYGVGNLFSLESALALIGEPARVSAEPEEICSADRLILPGVGAFSDARKMLAQSGLDTLICAEAEGGKPLLGICLGMQLLFDRSLEFGHTEGLGLIPGEVRSIAEVIPKGYKTPHIGWNNIIFSQKQVNSPILKYVEDGDFVYFVHSYAAFDCEESLLAQTEYGARLTAAVARGKVFGMQFHPEKSGAAGQKILKAFCELH